MLCRIVSDVDEFTIEDLLGLVILRYFDITCNAFNDSSAVSMEFTRPLEYYGIIDDYDMDLGKFKIIYCDGEVKFLPESIVRRSLVQFSAIPEGINLKENAYYSYKRKRLA